MKKSIVLLIILSYLKGNTQVRKYSNEFLKIGVGGQYLGTGGAKITTMSDPAAVFYNPGSLGAFDRTTISGMHNSYFSGIANFDYGGIIIPLKDRQNLGLSIIRMGIDDIPNTIQLYNADGSIDYSRISLFSVSDMAAFISFGKRMKDTQGLSIGGSVKIIKRDYGSFANAFGFGIDIGAQYSTDQYQIGAMIQDISTTYSSWKFSFTEEEKQILSVTNNEVPSSSTEITLPAIHLGGQYHFQLGKSQNFHLYPMAKLSIYTDQRNVLFSGPISIDAAIGVESKIWDIVKIRAGISNFTKYKNSLGEDVLSFTPSIGAGFKFDKFEIDYSYNNVANTGIGLYSHVFSAIFHFPKKNKYSSPTVVPNTGVEDSNDDVIMPISK